MNDLNGVQALPSEVKVVILEYLRLVDLRLPNKVEGFYLVGSLALNDYVRGVSDVDFVSVSAVPLSDDELFVVEKIHTEIYSNRNHPKLDGIYTIWSDLSRSTKGLKVHHWLTSQMYRNSSYAGNPVTWVTLKHHPLVVRQPIEPEIYHDESELKDWCRSNLRSYWRGWVNESRKIFKMIVASYSIESICWGVLGVIRLHATIKTGKIISKSEASKYGHENFHDEWKKIIATALRGRRSETDKMRIGFLRRRELALQFMEYVIDDEII